MNAAHLAALRARFRNACREYYGLAMRIDRDIDLGSLPSDEDLTEEQAAAQELSVARREWLRASLDSMG